MDHNNRISFGGCGFFLFLVILTWLAWGVWRLSSRPIVQLVTPQRTVVKQYAGLPPVMENPGR